MDCKKKLTKEDYKKHLAAYDEAIAHTTYTGLAGQFGCVPAKILNCKKCVYEKQYRCTAPVKTSEEWKIERQKFKDKIKYMEE